MIRALCTWSLKISAALYVRHFHFLHTIEEAEVLNQNEFDNFDNYNLNMLLIKKIILRAHSLGCQLILRGFGSFIVKQRA